MNVFVVVVCNYRLASDELHLVMSCVLPLYTLSITDCITDFHQILYAVQKCG